MRQQCVGQFSPPSGPDCNSLEGSKGWRYFQTSITLFRKITREKKDSDLMQQEGRDVVVDEKGGGVGVEWGTDEDKGEDKRKALHTGHGSHHLLPPSVIILHVIVVPPAPVA